jgi:hypothetical protein
LAKFNNALKRRKAQREVAQADEVRLANEIGGSGEHVVKVLKSIVASNAAIKA